MVVYNECLGAETGVFFRAQIIVHDYIQVVFRNDLFHRIVRAVLVEIVQFPVKC